MLNEDEKQRIREEELFRQEVRQQLSAEKPPPSIRKTVWSIVNSAFALWLLSTVVIGFFGWTYQNFQAFSQRLETKRKLATEMIYRLSMAESALDVFTTKIESGDPDSPKFMAARILGFLDGKDVVSKFDIGNVYPEYQNRNYLSLKTEMEGLTGEIEMKIVDPTYLHEDLISYSMRASEFQANDDVDKKIERAKEAEQKLRKFINNLQYMLSYQIG